jgi:hypothetical protein
MFHGHWDYFQEPCLGSRPNTKPRDHDIPNAHNHWYTLFNQVWGPTWIELHWNNIQLRAPVTYDFKLHWRIRDHTTWFWRVCSGGLWALFFRLSQSHGPGSWLVCDVALISVLRISKGLQQPFKKAQKLIDKIWHHGHFGTFYIKWPCAKHEAHCVPIWVAAGGLPDDMAQCHMTLGMLWAGHYWIGTRVGSGLAWIRWGLIEGGYVAPIAIWHQSSHLIPCHHHEKERTHVLWGRAHWTPCISLSIYILTKIDRVHWPINNFDNFVALVG